MLQKKHGPLSKVLALILMCIMLLGLIPMLAIASPGEEEIPSADMLDVDFSGGIVADHSPRARTFANNAIDANNIVWNNALGKYVGEINRISGNAWKTAWPAADWALINQSLTMEAVFRLDNPVTGSWMGLFGGMQSAGIGFDLYAGNATHAQLDVSAYINGAYRDPRSGNVIPFGEWVHAVATYDGAVVRLYINGELVSSVAYAGAITTPSSGAQWFVIGGDTTGSNGVEAPLDGAIGLARVYSTVLSPGQIKILADLALDTGNTDPGGDDRAPLVRTYDRVENADGTVTITASFQNDSATASGKATATLEILGDAVITNGAYMAEVTVAAGASESVSWTVKANTGSARLIVCSTVNGTLVEERVGKVASGGAGWISGDVHDHSRHSDGSGTIAENFAVAADAGMDYINISDHDNSRGWPEAQTEGLKNGIIPMHGNEYSGYGHAVFMNVDREFNYNAGRVPKAAIELFKEHTEGRGLAYAAHPYDTTVEADPWGKNDSWNSAIDGIEVWNGWYASNYWANKQAREQWDLMNNAGRHLYAIADTDTHSAAGIGAVYTSVFVEEYAVDGIIDAYQKGHMYGSNGPVIDFRLGSAMMGDDFGVPAGGRTVSVNLSGYYINDLSRVLLIKNGETIFTKEINAKSFSETVQVSVKPGDFLRMEVEGVETDTKKLTTGSYSTAAFFTSAPFAFSNPIFFIEDDSPGQDTKVTFGVLSDTHVGASYAPTSLLAGAFSFFSELEADAVAIVGDITENGSATQFSTFSSVRAQSLTQGILLTSMGNHEGNNIANYENGTGNKANYVEVINGYTFIFISPGSGTLDPQTGRTSTHGGDNYSHSVNWLNEQLVIAEAASPDRPIFVFFHHPIRNTHYTTGQWYGRGLETVFDGHPRVVTFSGHNHEPHTIPLVINQDRDYTTLGTSTLKDLWINPVIPGVGTMVDGDYPANASNMAQGMLLEVENNQVTVKNYDFLSGQWIDQTWSFSTADEPENAIRPYTQEIRMANAVKPVFGPDDKLSITDISGTSARVAVPQASVPDNTVHDMVQAYRIDFIDTATDTVTRSAVKSSEFYFIPLPETISYNMTGLVSGTKYEVRAYAIDAFGLVSDDYLSAKIIAGQGLVEEYTVTFNADGEIMAITVEAGEKAEQPEDPLKVGWLFDGWRLGDADGERYDFDTPVTEDIVLYAAWLEVQPEVTLTGVSAEASVTRLNGATNDLTIIITEYYSDDTMQVISEVFSIENNAADSYAVGEYVVYVDTKGNTQIRACYIVE
ncbi:MAG: CehA/McbA family metallohydrolase [Clostridiales bacterium]|nr:CehA/McbA family metallohydrolase [Clostridiales bacterium]